MSAFAPDHDHASDHAHDHHGAGHGHAPGFAARWLFSTNHKDIGTLYLIFAVMAGTVGGALSMIMRLELAHPGMHYFSTGQEWNTVVTAHGLLMIFFTVMPGARMLKMVVMKLMAPSSDEMPARCSANSVKSMPMPGS